MANIIPLKDNTGAQFYPQTHEKAVVDSNGVNLQTKLASITTPTYVTAWDGDSTPVVANIPSGVTVTYGGTSYTGTLAASASTANKTYLVGTGTTDNYYRYVTQLNGSTYSWQNIGSTEIDLSDYDTRLGAVETEVSQLEAEVDDLSTGKYYGYFAQEEDLPEADVDGFAYVGEGPTYTIYNLRGGVWTSSNITVNQSPIGNDEDIDQNEDGKLQFANRTYNAQQPNGMGYKILRKDASFASQVTATNTIYEIRYDFDLASAFTMPAGCVLRFVGGSISGSGTLTFTETAIEGDAEITCGIAGTIDGVVNVGWFGLKSDDSTFDNGAVINKVATVFNKVFIPAGDYYFQTPILFPNSRYIEAIGNLYYNGAGTAIAAVTVGDISNGVFRFYGIISGENASAIVYNSTGRTSVVGLSFQSVNNSFIEVKDIRNFNEGLRVMGSTQGSCYNQFKIGGIRDTNVSIRVTQDNGGWANQNSFVGGRLYNQTTWKNANPTAAPIAIKIQGPGTASDTYKSCNNLRFEYFSTEGFTSGYTVLAESVSRCRFIQFRNEGSSGKFIKFVGTCTYNVVSMGYASAASGTGTGGGTGIDISEANNYPLDFHDQKAFEIADLDVYVWERCYKNGTTENFWYFPKFRIVNFGYSDLRESHYSNNFTSSTLVPNGKGPTVIVDTSTVKFFRTLSEFSGRVFVRWLKDSSGNVIEGESAQKALGYPMGGSANAFIFSAANFCFQSAADIKSGVIGVPDGVSQIAISFNGGCKRMKVYSLDAPVVPVYFADEVLNGPTASRPAHSPIGRQYFDTDLGKYILWNGTAWVNLDGSALT